MTFTPTKENTPLARGVDGTENAATSNDTTTRTGDDKFSGTTNPRHLRAIYALLQRPMPREHLDREADCSNGPELIAELRRRGLDLPCDRIPVHDRDGLEVTRGVYHLTSTDRRKIHQWFAQRKQNRGA
jgi:hypothetical protein